MKAIDYMIAYGCGPSKLSRFDASALVDAADRWRSLSGGLVHMSLSAIEKAIQTRVDEEGCAAFFAAAMYPHAKVNNVAHHHTLCEDTCSMRHGDVNGGAVGDAMTSKSVRNQGVSPAAQDLGSGDNVVLKASTCEVTPG